MTNTETSLIQHSDLKAFAVGVLGAAGISEDHAKIVAECLLTANLSGIDSHGIVRLNHYIRRLDNGTIKRNPEIQFERKAPSLGYLDGGDGLGHVVTYQATTRVMELAAETGCGIVSIGNSSHFGMAAFYIMRLVESGYAGMCTTSTDRFVVPFGARHAFFGTNPIAFGFPTDGLPMILDMATSSVPYGKIALAQVEDRAIPAEWGVDAEGHPTTDPHAVTGIHPVAGPKGSGLAMVIDVLSSLLSGMPWGPHINQMYAEMESRRELGHFIMAIDVERLVPMESFRRQLGDMIKELTSMECAEGFDRIYYPGEIEGARREQRRRDGVPVDPGLCRELAQLGERFKIPFPG